MTRAQSAAIGPTMNEPIVFPDGSVLPPANWLRRQCPRCGLWVTGIVESGAVVAPHPCVAPSKPTSDLPARLEAATKGNDIVARINAACVGRPHAKISWPHRLLHDARAEIERLRAEIERRDTEDINAICAAALRARAG